MKTFSVKEKDITRTWYLIDADGVSLGRLSTKVASILTGKEKPTFTQHIDCGDYVVIVNAEKVKITGNKLRDKKYYRHSQYPGSLKEQSLSEMISSSPSKVLSLAVKGMLPKNKLIDQRLSRLKIFSGFDHDHEAQKPVKVKV